MITGAVRLSEDAPYCQVSGRPYALQRAIPSARGRVTPRSRPCLHGGRQNLNWLPITLPSRVTLRPRLTLIRLTLFRKPWVFGVDISISIVVTYAYIFFSHRSSKPHGSPSTPVSMLPYHCNHLQSLASVPVLMPAHHPRVIARLVSCYALFE